VRIAVRGAVIFGAVLIVPILLGALWGVLAPDSRTAFLLVWGWGNALYPHAAVYHPQNEYLPQLGRHATVGFSAALSHPALVAVCQWVLLGLVFAFATRRLAAWLQFVLAVILFVFTVVAFQWTVTALGLVIQVDGP
jgi:hypothetical protein